MPTYEYKCRSCGDQFEVFQPFTAEALTKCEECGGQLGKVFGNIGISFKGSGFYRTDSRATSSAVKTNGKDSRADTKSEAKSDSSSSSSSSKAAKSESKSESGSSTGSKSESPKTPKPSKESRSSS